MGHPVYKQRVDALLLPYLHTLTRNDKISFLPAYYFYAVKIAIPTSAVRESLDFTTFIRPLHHSLWIAIFLTIVIIAFAKMVLLERIQEFLWKSIKYFWDSVMPMFGATSSSDTVGIGSYNILLITSFLSGYVIWISYNAALTSELLVTGKSFPFSDLKSLSQTNWRYV